MATVLSTIYPPLVDTFMPAFPYTESAIVNFSISPYNRPLSISKLHVSIVDQRTNLSVLDNTWQNDSSRVINNIWVINKNTNYFSINPNNTCILTIPPEILKEKEEFNVGNYYKVQLRFSNDDVTVSNINSSYLTQYRPNFSEWSSICLIKAIPKIELQLTGYYNNTYKELINFNETIKPNSFPAGIIPIAGNVSFVYSGNKISTKDKETLRSYQINIWNKDDPDEGYIVQSETFYTYNNGNPNEISYLADLTNAAAGATYIIAINCITKNQYKFTIEYPIKIIEYSDLIFEPKWNFNWVTVNSYGQKVDILPELHEDGQLKITVSHADGLGPGYLYIKRATSLDNFKKWELLKCTSFVASQGTNVTDTVIDTTLGSLVRYKYSCQYRTKKGTWTKTNISKEIIYPDFHDILISRGNKQLAIRYNGQIGSMTPVVDRVKIDTLGGRYPKFAENARLNYKQFQLNGLIIAEEDYNRKFLSDLDYKDDMDYYDEIMDGSYLIRNDTLPKESWDSTSYGTYKNDILTALTPSQTNTKTQQKKLETKLGKKSQEIYNNSSLKEVTRTMWTHDLYPTNNWWWERLFREEAVKWLNDGEPKLFRSMTEGNMVVMLMNIQLTPNAQLGRRTYNFSATVYEVADGYSLETLKDLDIIEIQNDYDNQDEIDETSNVVYTTLGQLPSVQGSGNWLIQNWQQSDTDPNPENGSLIDKYNLIYGSGIFSSIQLVDNPFTLKNLKIQFESEPNWYYLSNNDLIKSQTKWAKESEQSQVANKNENNNHYYGYKIILNVKDKGEVPIFVNIKGYYQVPSNIEVLDIKLEEGDIASLDFIMSYKVEAETKTVASEIELSEKIVGQINGLWYPNTTLWEVIKNKYEYVRKATGNNTLSGNDGILETLTLDRWTSASFDLTPYTVLDIKFLEEKTSSRYIVGRTGIYNLMTDYPIEQVTINGRRMVEVTDQSRAPYLDEWEFILDPNIDLEKDKDLEKSLTYWYENNGEQYVETSVPVSINGIYDILDSTELGVTEEDINNYLGQEIKDIQNPIHNMVYKIRDSKSIFNSKYMIYYIDEKWYPVVFDSKDNSIIYAQVPVNGMINYRGDLIRRSYSSEE